MFYSHFIFTYVYFDELALSISLCALSGYIVISYLINHSSIIRHFNGFGVFFFNTRVKNSLLQLISSLLVLLLLVIIYHKFQSFGRI